MDKNEIYKHKYEKYKAKYMELRQLRRDNLETSDDEIGGMKNPLLRFISKNKARSVLDSYTKSSPSTGSVIYTPRDQFDDDKIDEIVSKIAGTYALLKGKELSEIDITNDIYIPLREYKLDAPIITLIYNLRIYFKILDPFNKEKMPFISSKKLIKEWYIIRLDGLEIINEYNNIRTEMMNILKLVDIYFDKWVRPIEEYFLLCKGTINKINTGVNSNLLPNMTVDIRSLEEFNNMSKANIKIITEFNVVHNFIYKSLETHLYLISDTVRMWSPENDISKKMEDWKEKRNEFDKYLMEKQIHMDMKSYLHEKISNIILLTKIPDHITLARQLSNIESNPSVLLSDPSTLISDQSALPSDPSTLISDNSILMSNPSEMHFDHSSYIPGLISTSKLPALKYSMPRAFGNESSSSVMYIDQSRPIDGPPRLPPLRKQKGII